MSQDHLKPYLELDGICRDPVFIIGSPRSGTTALGHALGRHPEFWASKESYVLHSLFGRGRAGQVWEQHQGRKNPSWLPAEGVERAEFLGFLGLGINAMYSSRSGGLRWVDATPLNTPMVADLAEMFPGATFLHMLRDGRSVVRSMGKFRESLEDRKGPVPDAEMPAWTEDFRAACSTWADHVDVALSFAEAEPRRCVTIRNEDLVADPGAGFARLHEFLRAADDPGPARFFSGPRINSSFAGAAGDRAAGEGWDPGDRELFARVAGPTLIRAGYLDSDGLGRWAAPQPQTTA